MYLRAILAAGLCCYGVAIAQQNPAPPQLPSASAGVGNAPAGVFRFQTVSIMDDPRHIGGEAYRILAPAGWRVEGNIIWKNAAADPAAPYVKLIGPARQEIGVLPSTSFIWNPQMLGPRFRPGSFYAGTEVQPPVMDPERCIRTIIIPRYRRILDNADVVKQEPLPELVQAIRQKYAGPEYQSAVFQAGKMRFQYVENGVPMEEDVYVVTAGIQFRVGPTVSTLWGPDEIRYSKAPKGTLDAQLALFETAMFSLRPNLKWWAGVQQVSQELARLQMQASTTAAGQAMQQQAAAADRMYTNRKLAENGTQINDMIMRGYQNRQATMDRINERWDRTVRQVEVYRNPTTGENIELPSGYNTGWVNKSGEYVVTGSVNYDPNSASNGAWTRLEKVSQ
ncbi:MAG TPA: hypothetical protein VKX49_05480 [Bryobacteraceae bacterium]|nr:hypothetical protein [Bryobacteraceae bacterium]